MESEAAISGAVRLSALARAGVRVARFLHSPWPWRMPFINLRNHRKLLLVDGLTGFAGGLNIGAENVTSRADRMPIQDTHFKFEGPVISQLAEVFADDWQFVTGETDANITDLPTPSHRGSSVARVVTSGPDRDIGKIELIILESVGCALSSIGIMTPYFLPDDRMMTALALAALRGVQVDIVLPARSNHRLLDWACRGQIGPLLDAGCRIWTHPAPFDHSKLMTVDGVWGLVGSANWDVRSLRLNFELDVEVYHSELVRQIDTVIRRQRKDAVTVACLQRRPWPVLLRDRSARLFLPYL